MLLEVLTNVGDSRVATGALNDSVNLFLSYSRCAAVTKAEALLFLAAGL
jgi:hypothetical protein